MGGSRQFLLPLSTFYRPESPYISVCDFLSAHPLRTALPFFDHSVPIVIFAGLLPPEMQKK
jgi:hypothetical protein